MTNFLCDLLLIKSIMFLKSHKRAHLIMSGLSIVVGVILIVAYLFFGSFRKINPLVKMKLIIFPLQA